MSSGCLLFSPGAFSSIRSTAGTRGRKPPSTRGTWPLLGGSPCLSSLPQSLLLSVLVSGLSPVPSAGPVATKTSGWPSPVPWGWPGDNLQSAAVCGFGHNARSHILMCSSWPRASAGLVWSTSWLCHSPSWGPLSHRAVSCRGLVADVLRVQRSWGSSTQHKGLLHCLSAKL